MIFSYKASPIRHPVISFMVFNFFYLVAVCTTLFKYYNYNKYIEGREQYVGLCVRKKKASIYREEVL